MSDSWSIDHDVVEAIVTAYWLKFYCDGACKLCGNSGWVDTTGVRTPAGVLVGGVQYCLCPEGKALRRPPRCQG